MEENGREWGGIEGREGKEGNGVGRRGMVNGEERKEMEGDREK